MINNNKLIRYLFVMFFAFIFDSVIGYFLSSSLIKTHFTMISYASLAMFILLNNSIDEGHRYIFSIICGMYYSVIYGDSIFIYTLLYVMYAFCVKNYMKKATFTYFEAIVMVVLTIFVQEFVLYLLMWIANTTRLFIITFIIKRLLPTILFNVVMFNGVYFIHHKIKLEGDINVYFN